MTAAAMSLSSIQWSGSLGAATALDDVVRAAAATGWRHVGIDLHSFRQYEAAGGSASSLSELLDELSLTCTDLIVLGIDRDRDRVLAQATELSGLAASLGAKVCAVAFLPGVDALDPEESSAVELMRAVSEVFSVSGVRLALEFLLYSPLRLVDQARSLAAMIGLDRVGVLVDSWHVSMTGQADQVATLAGDEIAWVQLSDAVPLGAHDDVVEASRYRRLIPGDGSLDLRGFVEAVRGTGYDGMVSPEVLSSELRTRPVIEAAARLYDATRRLRAPGEGTTETVVTRTR